MKKKTCVFRSDCWRSPLCVFRSGCWTSPLCVFRSGCWTSPLCVFRSGCWTSPLCVFRNQCWTSLFEFSGVGVKHVPWVFPGVGAEQVRCVFSGVGAEQVRCVFSGVGAEQVRCVFSGVGAEQVRCVFSGVGAEQVHCVFSGVGAAEPGDLAGGGVGLLPNPHSSLPCRLPCLPRPPGLSEAVRPLLLLAAAHHVWGRCQDPGLCSGGGGYHGYAVQRRHLARPRVLQSDAGEVRHPPGFLLSVEGWKEKN